jgi:putative transposase
MTNHIHLLVRVSELKILSKFMHNLHVAYVMYFNRKHQRSGHLFQDRFMSWVIKDEPHLKATKNYIERNPVNAGLAQAEENYTWSSANRDGSAITVSAVTG